MKKCCTCKEDKEFSCFHKNSTTVDGLARNCRQCKAKSDKKYDDKNKIQRRTSHRKYYEQNRSQLNANRRSDLNQKAKNAEYRKMNPEKVSSWKRTYYKKHKTVINQKWAERRRNNLDVRMANNLRSRLNKALKGNHRTTSTIELLGCSLDELKNHLASLFVKGMTWENYGSKWHIDHKVPCAYFDLKSTDQQKKCFHFSNLQPLWKIDNLKKNKYGHS